MVAFIVILLILNLGFMSLVAIQMQTILRNGQELKNRFKIWSTVVGKVRS